MWSDKESDKDYLNFGEVSQMVVDIISSPEMLPVSVGVFGNWGAGKSSLLRLIECELLDNHKQAIIIKFDAWLYQGYDDARAAFLEVIATELNKVAIGNETLAKKAKNLLSRVNGFRALSFFAEGAALCAGIPTGGLIARGIDAIGNVVNGIQDKVEFDKVSNVATEVIEQSSSLIKPKEKMSPPQQIDAFRKEYGEILEELNKPVVVIIDNLDRCLPTNAIHTLEAIRLFLFLNKTAFIIAADEEMIRSSVSKYFNGASERHQIDYLDKLIQVPIRVPMAGVREIRSYLFMLYAIDSGISTDSLDSLRKGLEEALQHSWKDAPISCQDALALAGEKENSNLALAYDRADRIAPILANSPIIHGNPRIVKRLLNVVKMRSQIATRRSMPLDEAIITKLVIFERCAGIEAIEEFYRLVDSEQGKPSILKKLEDNTNGEDPFTEVPKSWTDNPTTKVFIQEWAQLEPKLSNVDLRAAIYLSRETIPIGINIAGLSKAGREVLDALLTTKNISSPTTKTLLNTLPLEEQVTVMEGIINHLRHITDWASKPDGFSGGYLLADHSAEAAKIFKRFITGLESVSKQPLPWMNTLLKDAKWYKEY